MRPLQGPVAGAAPPPGRRPGRTGGTGGAATPRHRAGTRPVRLITAVTCSHRPGRRILRPWAGRPPYGPGGPLPEARRRGEAGGEQPPPFVPFARRHVMSRTVTAGLDGSPESRAAA